MPDANARSIEAGADYLDNMLRAVDRATGPLPPREGLELGRRRQACQRPISASSYSIWPNC